MQIKNSNEIIFAASPEKAVLLFLGIKRVILLLWWYIVLGGFLVVPFYGFISGGFDSYFEALFSLFSDHGGKISVSYLLISIIIFIYVSYLRRTYQYRITKHNIVFEGGILKKKIKNIQFEKVTNVDITQNIFERMLGISKLHIQTAGTGGYLAEIIFEGLKDAETPQKIILSQISKFNKNLTR